MPGGLKENVYWFCGEEVFIRQIEGERHAYDFLEDYKKRVLGGRELPFMVDALNCAKGCIYGTGVEEQKTTIFYMNCSVSRKQVRNIRAHGREVLHQRTGCGI